MAYVTNYKHDVFISYAHADDDPPEGVPDGWITVFFNNLNKRLKQKLGNNDVSVWMDHKDLLNHTSLTDQIMAALQQTATFLVVVSPSYLKSKWCGDEREEFLRMIEKRTRSNSHVFLVELDKVERGKFPAEFSDLLGYRFWVIDKETNVPRTLGTPFPDVKDQEYYNQLNRLSFELAAELERIKQNEEGVLPDPEVIPGTDSDKGTIYLAEVTDDIDQRREEVRDYLKQAGFNVLPETWRSYDDLNSFNKSMDENLKRCSVFVQLLSCFVGKKPFRQGFGYPRLQYARALQMGKLVMQWRDPKLDMSGAIDEDQMKLLNGVSVRAEGTEEFKRAIVEAATPKPEEEGRFDSGKIVFICADPADRSRTEQIISSPEWIDTVGYNLVPEANDSTLIRRYIDSSLLNCDAALVVYCGSDPVSIFNQVMYCRKIFAQRNSPPPTIAIYDGPPPPDEKINLKIKLSNLRHLDCRDNPTALKEFLESL
jgi:hypothetical protein